MAIIWDNAWNIGHAEIDKQHQHWIDLYNKLEDAFLNGSKSDLDALKENTLQKIVEYTDYHCETEEKFMGDHNYSEAAVHWRLHKDLKNDLHDTIRASGGVERVLNSQLLSLMKHWLTRHILVEDRKLATFLESQHGL